MKIDSLPVQEIMSRPSDITVQKKDEIIKAEDSDKESKIVNKVIDRELDDISLGNNIDIKV